MALTAPILGGKKTAKLDESVFALEVNESLLHEAVKAEAAGKRQGTHSTKTRGQVAGGRAKPWRQKGTGRAARARPAPRTGVAADHVRPAAPQLPPEDEPQGVPARPRHRPSVHASRGTLAAFDAAGFYGRARRTPSPCSAPRTPVRWWSW